MCGIAGYVRPAGGDPSAASIFRMTRAMRHRGPDDEGLTLIDSAGERYLDLSTMDEPVAVESAGMAHDVALGHRRFSIVDLSPGGHQPFWSGDGSCCLAFNGEIYNHIELRQELAAVGVPFRTHCDTEVLVEAYRRWGEDCFRRFVGFWAVALYDKRRRQVLLSRDRLGKAPLYIARHGGTLYWASEIGAILAETGRGAFAVREQLVADFIAHSWRDVYDSTFYEGITSFPAASMAWVAAAGTFEARRYWQLPARRMTEREISATEAADQFRKTLDDAVRVRMRADVPVGFELSGGVDSSCLVASAASQGFRLHAYTVSFPGTSSDEEPYARAVAERYPRQVEYTVLEPPREDFWEQADEYVGHMAEPFHAPNVLTNRGVWQRMAARGIKVSINGAAGDESWAGYFNDYFGPFMRHLAREGEIGALIRNARLFGDEAHGLFSETVIRRLREAFMESRGAGAGVSSPGSRMYELPAGSDPMCLRLAPGRGPARDLDGRMRDLIGPWRMNYWLRVANQSYMSVPTEVRCPFLDHRLVELAFGLPVTYLIRDGWLKWLVRTSMSDRLPAEVAWRKRKMGFPFPYEQWAAASRERFFGAIGNVDCPYVDLAILKRSYGELAKRNPLYLWRVMSVCLWWKKCVLGERLG